MSSAKVITVQAETVVVGDMVELDVGYGHPMDAMCRVLGVRKRKSFFSDEQYCVLWVKYGNEEFAVEFLPTHKVRVIKGA